MGVLKQSIGSTKYALLPSPLKTYKHASSMTCLSLPAVQSPTKPSRANSSSGMRQHRYFEGGSLATLAQGQFVGVINLLPEYKGLFQIVTTTPNCRCLSVPKYELEKLMPPQLGRALKAEAVLRLAHWIDKIEAATAV